MIFHCLFCDTRNWTDWDDGLHPSIQSSTVNIFNYESPRIKVFFTALFFNFGFSFSSFLGGAPTSICHFFRLSICRAPYLRNRTSSNQAFLSFFWNFGFLGKKWTKMNVNNYICHMSYLRKSMAYDHVFWYTCVKWWYLQVFFFFFNFHF